MNYNTPEYYKQKIKELDTKFSLILDEIIKSYSIYKMNPDYPEYQNLYSSNMSNLEKTKSDIFLLQNSLENDNQKIIDYITIADTKIEQLKDKNNILKSKFKYLYESNNTSDGLIDETQYLYNMKLLELFISLVGIVVILVFIKKE
jgi:FtsZ-binding cell division protein ZapB